MMELQGAPQPDSRTAAFLHSMLQLSDGPWSDVLLPKLIENGSAAAVALTCSQMRDLCYNSRPSVDLGGLLERTARDPRYLKSWVQGLPAHFPNCSDVALELGSNKSFHGIPYVLPALARLPKLDGLSITLTGDFQPLQAGSMLYSMRAQLPRLQGLTLTCDAPQAWATHDVFSELIDMTQLTRLCLNFKSTQGTNPLQEVSLRQLSDLKQLQHLAIRMRDWELAEREDHYLLLEELSSHGFMVPPPQLLSVYGLTALTRLETDLGSGETLFGVSTCVSLQHLEISVSVDIKPDDYKFLAPLTRLTHLRLLDAAMHELSPEATGALSKLTKLQVVAAGSWSPAFLPALATCVQLTEICGLWQDNPMDGNADGPAGCALPQVLNLSPGICTPPFECFPNLRHLRADNFIQHEYFQQAISVPALRSLCKHCTSLRELVLTASAGVLTGSLSDPYQRATEALVAGFQGHFVPPAAASDAADCTAAIQALTSLQHLTCLKFSPNSKYEMLALVQACSVLEGHSLQELHVVEGRACEVRGPGQTHTYSNAAAWSQLGRMHRLRVLSVVINRDRTYRRLVREADVFLSALSGCSSVVLHLPGYTAPFDAALFDLKAAGVPAPGIQLVQLESFQRALFGEVYASSRSPSPVDYSSDLDD